MKSIKTTLAGIGTFLAAVGPALASQFDNDPLTIPNWGIVVADAIAAWGLISARDNNVTSREAGAE